MPEIKQNITNVLQNQHFAMVESNRKLQFYSSFKTDRSSSLQLELIKNLEHRQSVAKLRSASHNLRIEAGRRCVPKIPEHLRICQYCSSNEIENEFHFLFPCNLNKCIRKRFFGDINVKYHNFNTLSNPDKIRFLSNNIDPFICKIKGY